MENAIEVKNNTAQMRFEVEGGGALAYIEYRYYKQDIAFMHSFVPDSMAGKGIGSAMAKAGLAFAREQKKKIMLYCPFVSKYVKEHPEYHDLVDREYHQNFLR